jgi:hypothetical protein
MKRVVKMLTVKELKKRLFINACHPSKPGLSEKEYAGNIFNAFMD